MLINTIDEMLLKLKDMNSLQEMLLQFTNHNCQRSNPNASRKLQGEFKF